MKPHCNLCPGDELLMKNAFSLVLNEMLFFFFP